MFVSAYLECSGRKANFGVNKPEASSSFIFRQTLFDEILDDLLRNAHTGASSSHEDSTVLLYRNSSGL